MERVFFLKFSGKTYIQLDPISEWNKVVWKEWKHTSKLTPYALYFRNDSSVYIYLYIYFLFFQYHYYDISYHHRSSWSIRYQIISSIIKKQLLLSVIHSLYSHTPSPLQLHILYDSERLAASRACMYVQRKNDHYVYSDYHHRCDHHSHDRFSIFLSCCPSFSLYEAVWP